MDILEEEDISISDFENMLLNADEMEVFLKKLKESCSDFHAKFERGILESMSKSSESAKRLERSHETLTLLSSQRKELKSALENVKLEQKIVEKKAINTMKEIEKTKTKMEHMKELQEKLSLEIVDLQQESEKSKENMKKQWEAVKKACRVYKNILDLHIDVETIDYIEHVTVTLFWSENPTDKKFFVILVYEDNCWKVKKIEPELSMEQKYQLNHIVQFSKQAEVTNVTSLLCELRLIFLKKYF